MPCPGRGAAIIRDASVNTKKQLPMNLRRWAGKGVGGSGKRSLRSLPMVLTYAKEPSASVRLPLPPKPVT
jgi:hypothetical protein